MKPIIKKFLTIILMFTFNETFSQGTWERINSPVTENLSSVFFVDSLYGWAAGDLGTIIQTTNGGTNWLLQNSNSDSLIVKDVFFLDRTLGWAIGLQVFSYPYGTYILKTTDGGTNWTKSTKPEENIFSQCILFLDSLNGWMVGKPTSIVRTTDGGSLWTVAEIDSSTYSTFPAYDIKFYNNKFGYASGGKFDCCGIMWWTTNGGDYWFAADTPNVGPEPIYQIHISDSLNVLGVGGDADPIGLGAGIIRTLNGGETWNYEYLGIFGIAWDIDFRTESEAWVPLGGEEKLLYSLDSGLNWTAVPTPDSAIIFKMIFTDSLHGYGVGMDGAIIKYKPDSTTDVLTPQNVIPEGFTLQQNYPNPFNPTTKIEFGISNLPNGKAGLEFVRLKVYDILGNEVATLVNKELAAGSYEIIFNAGELSSGVYYYTLSTSDFMISKKMILLH